MVPRGCVIEHGGLSVAADAGGEADWAVLVTLRPAGSGLRGQVTTNVLLLMVSGQGGDQPCVAADLAPPLGVLDLADVQAFVAGFTTQDPIADVTDDGVFDLADVQAFITAFSAGCP